MTFIVWWQNHCDISEDIFLLFLKRECHRSQVLNDKMVYKLWSETINYWTNDR